MRKIIAFILACILGFVIFFIIFGSINLLLLFNNVKMGSVLILLLFAFLIWITKRFYFFFCKKLNCEHTEEEQK